MTDYQQSWTISLIQTRQKYFWTTKNKIESQKSDGRRKNNPRQSFQR